MDERAIRNLVIAGSGNAGAGVEAVLISGAEAAEALRPGLLTKTRTSVTLARQPVEIGRRLEEATS
jgi:all-trans-retinol 13,14-reductase